MKNPDWERDEVILAVDLYFRAGRKQLPATDPRVIELSMLLNRLPLHSSEVRDGSFRNPSGISMILGNLLGIDPLHPSPGLSKNNRLQEEVWQEYSERPNTLRQIAEAIVVAAGKGNLTELQQLIALDTDSEFPEGRLLSRLHFIRERNSQVTARKKQAVLESTGCLACEVCEFDFEAFFGEVGKGFAECHHTLPLFELPTLRVTRLSDLAIVCANCHRMLHRVRPTLSVEALRKTICERARKS